jgi:hypothetical protein
MGKLIRAILLGGVILDVTACSSLPAPAPHIEYQTVVKPVYYVPAPPHVDRPALDINNLTDAQKNDIGQLAAAYKITIKELEDYSIELETIIAKYAELSKNNQIIPTQTPPTLDNK